MARSVLNFLGFGTGKTKAEGDPPKDDETNKAEEEKDKKEAAVDPDDEDDDEEDDEEMKAAARAAVLGERQRVAAIVTAGGQAKVEVALQIALNTDLTVDEATKLLGALPASAAGRKSPLAVAMEGRSPQVGAGSGAPPKRLTLGDMMHVQLKERGLQGKEA